MLFCVDVWVFPLAYAGGVEVETSLAPLCGRGAERGNSLAHLLSLKRANIYVGIAYSNVTRGN